MSHPGELAWKGERLYQVWQDRHKYIGTLVGNAGGQWAAWSKGVRLGSWGDRAAAERALEEYARLEPKPHNQTQYLRSLNKDAK